MFCKIKNPAKSKVFYFTVEFQYSSSLKKKSSFVG